MSDTIYSVLPHGAEKTTYTAAQVGGAAGTKSLIAYSPGDLAVDRKGGLFAFCDAGEALAVAHVVMQKDIVAAHAAALVPAAAPAVGDNSVTIQNATTAMTADQYRGGVLFVTEGTGAGQAWRIADRSSVANDVYQSHAAVTSTGVATFYFEPDDKVKVALAVADSLVGIRANPYVDAEDFDADDVDGVPLGVTVVAIGSGLSGWIKLRGPASVLAEDTNVLGQPVTVSESVNGAVQPYNEDGTANLAVLGHVLAIAATAKWPLIALDFPISS